MIDVAEFKRLLGQARWGAHRGDEAHYPENTASAFMSALTRGARCIETDLRVTRDGVVVLCHDPRHDGRNVESENHKSLGLPTLDDLLALTPEEIILGLEIKPPSETPSADRLVRKVLAAISRREGPLFFLSFSDDILATLSQRAPGIPRVLNVSSGDLRGLPSRKRAERFEMIRGALESGAVQGVCLSRKLLRHWLPPDRFPLLTYTLRTARDVRHYSSRYPIDLAFLSNPDHAAFLAR